MGEDLAPEPAGATRDAGPSYNKPMMLAATRRRFDLHWPAVPLTSRLFPGETAVKHRNQPLYLTRPSFLSFMSPAR